MNKESRKIISDYFLDEEVWDYDGYYLHSLKYNISLWVANGITFFNTSHSSNTYLDFGFVDKLALYPKAKKLIDKIILRKLKSYG